ncbi:hypothetical protein BH20ACT1_BH20ACT1_12470 [soil metagenome]
MSGANGGRDSSNRLVVTVIGLILVGVGGYGLARGVGAFGPGPAVEPLVDRGLRSSLSEQAGWVGGAATFVAVLVAWVGWRWLRLQLAPSSTLARLTVGDGQGGRTSVDGRALSDAIARDLEASLHVAAARARLVGENGIPGLELAAEMGAGADPQAVRTHVADHVLPRARTALGRDDLTAHVRLHLADPAGRALE